MLHTQSGTIRNALVAGATGLVGSELVQILIKSDYYNSVHIIGRRPYHLEHEKIKSYVIDFDKIEDFRSEAMIHDVYVCLGTTMKKAGSKENFRKVDYGYVTGTGKWAKANGAERLAFVSSVGANAMSRNFYLRTKGEAEKALVETDISKLLIVRPSLLLGKREEFRFAEKAATIMTKPLKSLLRGRLQKYSPVEASQVAAAMVKLLQSLKEPFHIAENQEILHVKF